MIQEAQAPIEVAMPRLSDSMEEATVTRWVRVTGDSIAAGDELAEIETDKANVGYEAEAAGVLETIVAEGETVALGTLIARIHPPGTTLETLHSAPSAPAGASPESQAPAVHEDAPAPAIRSSRPRPNATPFVRRLAAEQSVDLASLAGTGPNGRIVKADVLAVIAPQPQRRDDAPPEAPVEGSTRVATSIVEPTRAQQVVARRMVEAKAAAPEFTASIEVDVQAIVDAREQWREQALAGHLKLPVPSLNDFVVKAVARALRQVPQANGRYRDDRFELYGRVNVGIAVAHQDSLLVPVIVEADQKSLSVVAGEARRLIDLVRNRSIGPADLVDGTFTVSNLGMFGIREFAAIINQGQAGILAVGEVSERAVVRAGNVVPRAVATMTLTADHRILYGADAAAFLTAVRAHLEAPLPLLLGA